MKNLTKKLAVVLFAVCLQACTVVMHSETTNLATDAALTGLTINM